jgi:hypothetical protein
MGKDTYDFELAASLLEKKSYEELRKYEPRFALR